MPCTQAKAISASAGGSCPRPRTHAVEPELPVIRVYERSLASRKPSLSMSPLRKSTARLSCLLKEEAGFRAIQRADKHPAIEKPILLLAGSFREKRTGMAGS